LCLRLSDQRKNNREDREPKPDSWPPVLNKEDWAENTQKGIKSMKKHPFVNTTLIQTLEEEIKLFEQGEANVAQAKSIAKVAQRLISFKKLEIQEEEKILRELMRKIKGI